MTATALHPAIGSNSFCGPAAIASVFGISTGEAAAAIRQQTGKRSVFGVHHRDMHNTLNALNAAITPVCLPVKPLPPSKLADRLPHVGRYIVNVTGHYVALDTDTMTICDNHTIYPLALDRYRGRNKRVKRAWYIGV